MTFSLGRRHPKLNLVHSVLNSIVVAKGVQYN